MDPAAFDSATLSSDPSDSDDIRWALETASAMWTKGDHHEALRWLRRAAETASEEGSDARAVELAKLAAELRSRITVTEIPPEVAPQSSSVSPNNGQSDTHASPASHAADGNHSGDEVFERAAQALLSAEAPLGAAWSPAERAGPTLVPSPIQPVGSSAPVEPQPDPPARKSIPHRPAPPSSTPFGRRSTPPPVPLTRPAAASTTPAAPAARPSVPPNPPPSLRTRPSSTSLKAVAMHQAVRVAILSSTEKGVLMARVLGAGEHAPAGAKEALFVALEPGVDLIGHH